MQSLTNLMCNSVADRKTALQADPEAALPCAEAMFLQPRKSSDVDKPRRQSDVTYRCTEVASNRSESLASQQSLLFSDRREQESSLPSDEKKVNGCGFSHQVFTCQIKPQLTFNERAITGTMPFLSGILTLKPSHCSPTQRSETKSNLFCQIPRENLVKNESPEYMGRTYAAEQPPPLARPKVPVIDTLRVLRGAREHDDKLSYGYDSEDDFVPHA